MGAAGRDVFRVDVFAVVHFFLSEPRPFVGPSSLTLDLLATRLGLCIEDDVHYREQKKDT